MAGRGATGRPPAAVAPDDGHHRRAAHPGDDPAAPDAFGVRPFDAYGCTEGLWGSECEHHQGIHLFEDTTLVENVDADGQPVPAGEPGARLLVTNLYNLVQPLLRLEVTDLVTLDPDPCPCGRSLVRAAAIHGRSDDILSLPARDGGRVSVHPLQFALLTRDPQLREFQVIQDGPVLRILIVPSHAPAAGTDDLETRLGQAITHQLHKLGVHDPQVTVERRQQAPPLSRRQTQTRHRRPRRPTGPHQRALTAHHPGFGHTSAITRPSLTGAKITHSSAYWRRL